MTAALKQYLLLREIATSRSTPYHPQGNSQCERINQTVWLTVKLMLCNKGLSEQAWVTVLPEALHSVRSLLYTAMNATPHECFLPLNRRSRLGQSLPSWLIQPGPVMLRKFVRSKSEPLCEEVELLEASLMFAYVRFPDGKESSVSIKDLSPCPSFDTSSRPSVETFADNVPESFVAELGRELDVTAPPVVNEPVGGSSSIDHGSAGDNAMPPRSLHA